MNLTPGLSRRSFLAAAASASGVLALPHLGSARSLAAVSTALGWIPNSEYAGLWVAIENGYFAEEGIDISYTPGGPNAPGVLVQLAANQTNVAGGDWLPLFEAIARDNDFVVLGAAFPIGPSCVLSLPAAPVHTVADLQGKRILSQMPADKHMYDFVLKKAGLEPDYEIVPSGFSPEPLLAGDGEVYTAFATNQPGTLEAMGLERGKDFFVTMMSDLGYNPPIAPIVAQRAYVAENRDLVVGYLRALLRGWIENGKDPSVGATLAVEKYGVDFGLDLDQQIKQSTQGQALITAEGAPGPFWFDAALVDTVVRPIAEAAGMTGIPPAAEIVDLGPLEEVLASL